MDQRRLLAIGTGVAMEIAGQDLRVVLVRVRPNGVRVLGSTTLAGFRQRPAAEWGAEYAQFLRRMGAGYLAATVLLPRAEVIVRQLDFPGVAGRDLASAIRFQIDSLHPYGEDEALYGWARLRGTPAVLIGIAHKAAIERYSQMFVEAGIKVASFTFSAAVAHSALRILTPPPAEGFLAIAGDGELEAYGESPARPVFSSILDSPAERAASQAAAQLRLPPETQPVAMTDILPRPKTCPADFDLSRAAMLYATALAGACPWLALRANLLPRELRSSSSRAVFVPSMALAAILLALVAALTAQTALEERRQLSLLGAEIARFESQARQAEALGSAAELARERIRLLDDFRRRTGTDLDALNELTGLLQAPAWLNGLEMNRDSIVLTGQIEQAAPLLKLLDNSPRFQNSEFVGAIRKSEKNEQFRIRAAREGVTP